MLSSDAVALFLDDRRARNCRPRTIEFYERELARIERVSRELPSTPGPLKAVLASVKGSESSVYATYRSLKVLYRFLKRDGEIETNPMERIGAPIVHRKDARSLDPEDAARLLGLDISDRDRAMLVLLLDSGIRSGELRALRGLHLEHGQIKVNGKTGERAVPIHDTTMGLLREQVSTPDDYLFRTIDGRPLSRGRVYLIVRRALEKAGLDGETKNGAHVLRHTFGRSWCAEQGPLPALQKILGHSQITTTMIYVNMATKEVKGFHTQYSTLTTPKAMRLVK